MDGTTILMIPYRGGVVLASDSRVTIEPDTPNEDYFDASKIYQVAENVILAFAGIGQIAYSMAKSLYEEVRKIKPTYEFVEQFLRDFYEKLKNTEFGCPVSTIVVCVDGLRGIITALIDENNSEIYDGPIHCGSGAKDAELCTNSLISNAQHPLTRKEAIAIADTSLQIATLADKQTGGFAKIWTISRKGIKFEESNQLFSPDPLINLDTV